MTTKTEIFNEEITNKLFKNKRGNFVHIKLIEKHTYLRKEKKFDMCEAATKEEAIKKQTGLWMFSNNIKKAIKNGNLILVS